MTFKRYNDLFCFSWPPSNSEGQDWSANMIPLGSDGLES